MVGVFVAVMLAALVAWIALLSGATGSSDHYVVRYAKVSGLKAGAQVQFQGHPIGMIDAIRFLPVERVFEVDVSIERGWPIPEDSVARIASSGLLSAVLINVEAGVSDRPLDPGSRIQSEEPADLLSALPDAISTMVMTLDEGVRPLLADMREDLPQLVEGMGSLLGETEEAVARINQVLDEENTQRVDRVMANLDRGTADAVTIVGEFRETRAELHEAVSSLNALVQNRDDDLAAALSDLRITMASVARHIDAVNANLESATRDLADFGRQVRADPSLLVRGREQLEVEEVSR